ncbi:hypothetical protein [Hymenobacter sp. BT730]|uniref:hypothetical protein n=1 Tax=Hymenobacter sp. BT730 TaxID=3063332 RepID=UPI0026DFA73A|nr:hypothetical protein [Hymenobacter sp. BT730]
MKTAAKASFQSFYSLLSLPAFMSFTGSEGTFIELGVGHDLTSCYQGEHTDEVRGYFFGKTKLQSLLNQPGCVGIRIYYGQDGTGPKLVLAGVTNNENDIITLVLDAGVPSPPASGISNQLNNITSIIL